MKKLALLLLVMALPASAFNVEKTLGQVLREVKEHERLSSGEYKQLKRQFLKDARWETDCAKLLDSQFSVSIENLRMLKSFVKRRRNPLFQDWLVPAVEHEDCEAVRFLVTELGVDVNAQNGLALAKAASFEGEVLLEMVQFLLEEGAGTEGCHRMQRGERSNALTPLGLAAFSVIHASEYSGIKKKIEILLHYGARIDAVDQNKNDLFQLLELECDQYERDIRDGSNNSYILGEFHDNREMLKKKLNLSVVPENATDWQALGLLQSLDSVRNRIAELRELPIVAEKMAERQAEGLAPFLPGKHGVVGHVLEYLEPETLVEHREQKRIERNRDRVLAQVPNLADLVGDYLPWELEEEDGQDGEIESGLSEKVDEQENKSEDTGE